MNIPGSALQAVLQVAQRLAPRARGPTKVAGRLSPVGVLLISTLIFVTSLPAAAQEPPVRPGDRVRVLATAPQMIREVCTVLELRSDTLLVDRDGELAIPLASIRKLEVTRGRKSHTVLGGAIGFAVGFGPMFALCQAGSCGDLDDGVTTCCLELGVWAGTLTGVVGALLGSGKVDQWEEMPVARLRVSIVPHRDRGIAIVVSFHLRQQ